MVTRWKELHNSEKVRGDALGIQRREMLLTIKELGQISGRRWNESSIFKSMWDLDKMEKAVEYQCSA